MPKFAAVSLTLWTLRLHFLACLFSSVGQSTWFVISGSLVRIRQEAQKKKSISVLKNHLFFRSAFLKSKSESRQVRNTNLATFLFFLKRALETLDNLVRMDRQTLILINYVKKQLSLNWFEDPLDICCKDGHSALRLHTRDPVRQCPIVSEYLL